MAISDVTIQDGLKHPYLLTLVRWCVSSFWTTATVILQRLIAARIPQVKAVKPRPASYGHLHPEPRVHCEVLHSPPLPEDHTLDVIFVHGLYGSLGNTWRQGEWHNKYEKAPAKVPLRRPHSVPTCKCSDEREKFCSDEIGERNAKITPHTEIRRTSGNENYRCVDINVKNELNSQLKRCSCGENAKLKDINVNDAPLNELNAIKCCDIEINEQIRQKNLKGDTDIRKIDCSIETTESNHDIFDLRIPSDIKRSISDVNIRKHYNNKYTDEKINESAVNSDMYDNEHDVNIEKDYVTRSGEDIIKGDMKTNLYDHIQKILPNENLLITEKFYNNTLLDDVDIGSYETQAQFVKDLFKNSVNVKSDESESEVKASDCKCEEKCEPGCGCICDDCYSPCWPRDWIRVDYPGARVISINYTSDPYLWRPLWVKESKRLRLHERAEQMTSQLLELGVGERPIIWVGHSKGGLFIKKIYCEAYEAHLKLAKQNATKEEFSEETNEQNTTECRNDNEINHYRDKMTDKVNANVITAENSNENEGGEYENNDIENQIEKINEHIQQAVVRNDGDIEMNKEIENGFEEKSKYSSIMYKNSKNYEKEDILIAEDCDNNGNIPNFMTDNADSKENKSRLYDNAARAQLWRRSAGFMFYSVPHRGSPLADIKTPITARSVELMEICKDCPLVLSLQDSWSVATAPATPPVRSVVETCRTLMSVLYLRIVSVDSADPGIGSLYGVNVDHREICKPSSRSCLLYQELMALMEAALSKTNSL